MPNKKRGLGAASQATRNRVAKMGGEARGKQRKNTGDEEYFHQLRGNTDKNQYSGQDQTENQGKTQVPIQDQNENQQGSTSTNESSEYGSFGSDDNDR